VKVTMRTKITALKEQLSDLDADLLNLSREEQHPEINIVLYKCSLMARLIELELEGIVKSD